MADGSQLQLPIRHELVVDLFAGGGGASSGLARAYREPDVAVNHNPVAIAVHQANHPGTRHYTCDVFEVDPIEATGGQPAAVKGGHHNKPEGCGMHNILEEIKAERAAQDAQWGGPEHDDEHDATDFLEFIEAQIQKYRSDESCIRDRLVKIAALAVAACESFDRRVGNYGGDSCKLDELVNRFLTWPVPADVYPDGTPGQPGRSGTNLLTARQAKDMLTHVLGDALDEAAKSERLSVASSDIVESQIIAMRAAVVAAKLEGPDVGMQWIVNTLDGPGHLPDIDNARALGGAQAMFDKDTAEHKAFRAANPAP